MTRTLTSALALAAAGLLFTGAAEARDQIRAVGSSTVYPFTTAVAEQFGKQGSFKTPVIESTGTGGGFKLFCAGVGEGHPDVVNASRAIKKSEFDDCAKNGVKGIVELKIGFDGIVIAQSKNEPALKLTRGQLFLALAKEVPGADGKLVANPNKNWSDIDASLPNNKIEVLGPPPTSGTRDAFLELFMEKGAEEIPAMAALKKSDAKAFGTAWKLIREDGAYVDAGENDNLIVQKLQANSKAVGIFGYSFLEENAAQIQGAEIEGTVPTYEAIADGKYEGARPLFVYVKKDHVGVIPGIAEFSAEFVSDKAIGEDGYLASKGLVALPDDELKAVQQSTKDMTPIQQPAS